MQFQESEVSPVVGARGDFEQQVLDVGLHGRVGEFLAQQPLDLRERIFGIHRQTS